MSNFFSTNAIKAGLIVGTFDILAAFIQTYIKVKRGPDAVLRYIASAAFGKEAFTDGKIMILTGLLFHYIIAISFTFLFFWLAQKIPLVLKYKIPTAIVYSIFMWSFMQFIALPFTRLTKNPFDPKGAVIAITILIVCIGIPLSYMVPNKK